MRAHDHLHGCVTRMSGPRWITVLTLLAVGGCTARPADNPSTARSVHWSYEGARGPAHWSELSAQYAGCRGERQSPVDLLAAQLEQGSVEWMVNYATSSLRIAHHEHVTDIVDNGHTIQVSVDPGSRLTTPNGEYELKQFHFHTPSEHALEGRHTPMEVHFVHQDARGNFAVIALLMEEGQANDNLAKLIEHLPAKKGDAQHFPHVQIDLALHMPADNTGYVYAGSLTTPPCLENVEWLVLRTPIAASAEQLSTFAARLGPSNRPVQSLHSRMLRSATVIPAPGD